MAGTARRLIEAFQRKFQTELVPRVYRAPGRVNLIGEHTDYNLGFVLPVALELACYVAVAPRDDGWIRVYSANMDQERSWPVEALEELQRSGDWSDYVAGVAVQLHKAGVAIHACDLYIDSEVPTGSGLSSSAALEVSTALAFLDGRPMDPLELARICRAAEVEFVGMPCGIMDQYISIFGRRNAALKIDCRSLKFDVVRLPERAQFVAVNTMVKHELGSSAYRDRVRECQEAVARIQSRYPSVQSLRDATLEHLGLLDGVVLKRARHVITENERVERFVTAAARADLVEMGRLFVDSHRSLQYDYEVSCEELDFLVDTAIAIPGVYGARMTGGGFGGCTVNLMAPSVAERFRQEIAAKYRERFGFEPAFYPVVPSDGAGPVVV